MRVLNALLVLIAAIVVILLVVRLPPPSPEMTEAEIAQHEAEVSEREGALTSAIESWDFDTYRDFFSSDFSWALSGEVHHSLDSWLELVRPAFTRGSTLDSCEYLDRRFQVLNRDVVISTSVVNCFAPSPDGPLLVIDHTVTAVWERVDQQWKVVNLAETS